MCVYATNAPATRSRGVAAAPPMSPEPQPTGGTPAWAYAIAVLAVILAVAFVVLHLTGEGFVGH